VGAPHGSSDSAGQLDTRNESRHHSWAIRSFKDKRAKAIFDSQFVTGLDGQIQQRAREKLIRFAALGR
jgi:hypothetical protein